MLESITLLGSSSGRNAGDAALISGIMDPIDAACGRKLLYEIPTINPSFVRKTYKNRVQPVSMLPWNGSLKMLGFPTYNSVMRTDLTLIFDAILFDRALFNPLFNFMSTLSLILPRAKRAGKRIGFYNVGAGPVTTKLGRRMLRDLGNLVDFITVRDQDSFDILREIGVTNPRMIIGADAAIGVAPCSVSRASEILARLGMPTDREILAININAYLDTWAGGSGAALSREKFLQVYAEALQRTVTKLGCPVLFVSTQHHDVKITEELMHAARLRTPTALLSNREYNHFEIKGVLGKTALLFAMRLHAAILASSVYTPVLGLQYQPKVKHYFNTLGLTDCCLPFDEFTVSALEQHILRGWKRRESLRLTLQQRIPELVEKSLIAAHLAAELSARGSLEHSPLLAANE